jgi:large subunit ribosomal protein L4e
MLKAFGAHDDVEKVIGSKTMRAGKGKMRNRRFVQRRGPLVIYGTDGGLTKAFRNIPGVELAPVSSLNLLQLAPGGHVGRFCIWTESAFEQLDAIFGTADTPSSKKVHNGNPYRLPRGMMTNSDLSRIINSDEVQSVVEAPKEGTAKAVAKINPLKGTSAAVEAMAKLNPAMADLKRKRATAQTAAEKAKKSKKSSPKSEEVRKGKKAFYRSMVADS